MKKYIIDIYIVDDHRMVCEGIAHIINQSEIGHVSYSFNTLETCWQMLEKRRPDILLLDISMPDGDGISFCQKILKHYPKVKVIALTIHDEYSMIQRMMTCGAHAYVLKNSSSGELLDAICHVWQGHEYVSPAVAEILDKGKLSSVILTEVEQNILKMICSGMTNPQIATELRLSTETINWYRKRLLAKFGVNNTVSLVRIAMNEKII